MSPGARLLPSHVANAPSFRPVLRKDGFKNRLQQTVILICYLSQLFQRGHQSVYLFLTFFSFSVPSFCRQNRMKIDNPVAGLLNHLATRTKSAELAGFFSSFRVNFSADHTSAGRRWR
ncbi:MAG TPA: hypothetical protein VN658_00510 [Candidatus Acidoferrales bacterium]|nr:hypothetical protein [Candidatus Acidoferrales bacterium]